MPGQYANAARPGHYLGHDDTGRSDGRSAEIARAIGGAGGAIGGAGGAVEEGLRPGDACAPDSDSLTPPWCLGGGRRSGVRAPPRLGGSAGGSISLSLSLSLSLLSTLDSRLSTLESLERERERRGPVALHSTPPRSAPFERTTLARLVPRPRDSPSVLITTPNALPHDGRSRVMTLRLWLAKGRNPNGDPQKGRADRGRCGMAH